MKLTKILLCTVVAGAMAFAAKQAAAFPLTLTSESGKVNLTVYYGTTNDPGVHQQQDCHGFIQSEQSVDGHHQ